MINKQAFNDARAVMQRVIDANAKLDMGEWQTSEEPLNSLEEIHSCGMAACFGGYVAVSPEFKATGGRVGNYGEPKLHGLSFEKAIAEWLVIETVDSKDLCCTDRSYAYNKPFEDITPQDVIEFLNKIEEKYAGDKS